jgi:hypothetical protein
MKERGEKGIEGEKKGKINTYNRNNHFYNYNDN